MSVQFLFHYSSLVMLFVFAALVLQNLTMAAAGSHILFHMVPHPVKGPVRIGKGWHEISAGACVAICRLKFRNCRTFMYNESTGLCTPGSWINEQHPLPSAEEGSLFHSFDCSLSDGFSLLRYGSYFACIGKFSPPMSYLNAKEACRRRGGFLASVKTVDKMLTLENTFEINEETWVGADDLVKEGHFVWVEDGEVLEEGSSVFAEYQPDNLDDNEHCLSLQREGRRLGDWECSRLFRYFCEISVP